MTPLPPSPLPAALPAFLRGVERRAAVLAELQCGDAAVGDAALAAAMRAFRGGIDRLPLAQWPLRFWTLLLAAPPLRRPASVAAWGAPWHPLAALGNGPRAALLLRLAAGLEADTAAAVLAVASQRYQQALARALPRHGDGSVDPDALLQLEEAVQQRIRQLPAPRLAQLAQLRERALLGTAPPPRVAAPAMPRPRWPLLLLWLGVALCGLAFIATFFQPTLLSSPLMPAKLAERMRGDGTPRIRRKALPPADAPATRFDADFGAVIHRDFALLADPEGLRRAQALPLLSWYAAELAAAPAAAAAPVVLADPSAGDAPAPMASAPAGPAPAALQAQLQRLPIVLRASVQAPVATWSGWSEAQRGAYVERQRAWDALAVGERAMQRERYLAWRALPPATRSGLDAVATTFALLPAAEQLERREQFAALDRSTQRGWLLGPALGADYPKLQPLLAQLPEREHAPLRAALRAMSAAERADLAVLAQRVPPQERAALRAALMSIPAANRGAWLRMRLEQ